MPDRTILLEIDADGAVARMGRDRDRIEREDDGFHARVADAYRQLAVRFPARYVTVDGTAAPETDRRGDLWSPSQRFLSNRGKAPAGRAPSVTVMPTPTSSMDRRASGRRRLAFAFAGALARRLTPGRRTHASRSAGHRAARRHDPDRRDPRAPSRSPPASVRGRSPRVPPALCAICSTTTLPTRSSRISRSRPLYATIVLVADELGPIPETIRSRCQPVPFRRLSERAVRTWLTEHAPELEEVEATAIARVAAGRLDRARRLIDPAVRERRSRSSLGARGPYLDSAFYSCRRVERAPRGDRPEWSDRDGEARRSWWTVST